MSECTLLWVEKGEKKAIFFPLRLLLWFPKVVGRQLLFACRRVSSGCHISQPVHLSWLFCLHLGKAVLVFAASEQEECAAVMKVGADQWAANAFLLCFQPCLEWAQFSGWGIIIIRVPEGGITPWSPWYWEPYKHCGMMGRRWEQADQFGPLQMCAVLPGPCKVLRSGIFLCELTGVCDWDGCRLWLLLGCCGFQSGCWSTSLGFLLLGW